MSLVKIFAHTYRLRVLSIYLASYLISSPEVRVFFLLTPANVVIGRSESREKSVRHSRPKTRRKRTHTSRRAAPTHGGHESCIFALRAAEKRSTPPRGGLPKPRNVGGDSEDSGKER